MEYALWIGLFVATSLLWAWLLFWGGAEWIEGGAGAALLHWFRGVHWSAQGIKIFAALTWGVQAIWFVLGLFSQEIRHFFQ
jgi:hypothetical protein